MLLLSREALSNEVQNRDVKKVQILTSVWGPMFAIDSPVFNRDDCLRVFYHLREEALKQGYLLEQIFSIEEAKECDLLIVFDVFPQHFAQLERIPKEKRVLFLWEPPSTVPENANLSYHTYFSKVYTWNDDLVDGDTYFKFYYPVLHPMVEPEEFTSKKLCAMITCNKTSTHPKELYTERQKVVQFFEEKEEGLFDLYGTWWPDSYRNYRGSIADKTEVLKGYKFTFAYENIRDIPGYVSEKIFDCFRAGSIPIYWGASNIANYVPRDCFIDRNDFQDNEELFAFLSAMSEEEHRAYIERIRAYLKGEQAHLYSDEAFIDTFLNFLNSHLKM
jgi:hypothetical protein